MDGGDIGSIVGGVGGGGIAAIAMTVKYAGIAAASAALGPVYPAILIGAAVAGGYAGHRFGGSGGGH